MVKMSFVVAFKQLNNLLYQTHQTDIEELAAVVVNVVSLSSRVRNRKSIPIQESDTRYKITISISSSIPFCAF